VDIDQEITKLENRLANLKRLATALRESGIPEDVPAVQEDHRATRLELEELEKRRRKEREQKYLDEHPNDAREIAELRAELEKTLPPFDLSKLEWHPTIQVDPDDI